MPTRTTITFALTLLALPAGADVLFVHGARTSGANNGTSWADAFRGPTALQTALSAARPGDEVWVAQGVYRPAPPGGPRTAAFNLRSGVRVLGGFAGAEGSALERTPGHTTTLSGDLSGNDVGENNRGENSARVVTGFDLAEGSLLDGFTITAAQNDLSPGDFRGHGGGLLLSGGAPTVRGCTFRANHAQNMGGGAAVLDGAAVFERCTFDGNNARSGYNLATLQNAATTVRGCRFVGDGNVTGGSAGIGIFSGPILADPTDAPALLVEDTLFAMDDTGFACPAGMGIYASQGSATVARCDFLHNITCGGGGGVSGDTTFTIDRCRFIGNEGAADGGAAIHTFGGRYTVTNSLFHANDRQGFSTISALGGTFSAEHCTFSNNGFTTGLGGGTHAVVQSSIDAARFRNCIFWGNISRGGNAVTLGSPSAFRFDRCLVQGWNGSLPGAGSFAADPLFADPDGPDNSPGNEDDDLRLSPGSPAIDRADGSPGTPPLDLDGLPRFRDDPASPNLGSGTPPYGDLGAYELQPPCPADFNHDGFLDFFDDDAFVAAFESGDPAADANADGFLDFFDYDAFVGLFEAGC